jgi:hypothetical protein
MTVWDHVLAFLGIRRKPRYPKLEALPLWQHELDRQMVMFGFSAKVMATLVLKDATGDDPRWEQPYWNSPDGPCQARTVTTRGSDGALFQVVKGLERNTDIIAHECLHAVLVTQFGVHGHIINLPFGKTLEEMLGAEGAATWRKLFRLEVLK